MVEVEEDSEMEAVDTGFLSLTDEEAAWAVAMGWEDMATEAEARESIELDIWHVYI
jgi:hypothetical protein